MTASGLIYGGMESCEGTGSWNVTHGDGQHWLESHAADLRLPNGDADPYHPNPTAAHANAHHPVTPTPTPTPQPAPSGTLVMAIDAGGSATGNFVADTDFNPATVQRYLDLHHYQPSRRVHPPGGLAECRWNASFTYTIPGLTAGHTYTVALDWAELTCRRRASAV